MIPRAALEQEREQEAIATIALRGVRRIWRRMARGNWERNWRTDVGPNIQQLVLEAQSAAAASADAYVAAVLAELDIEPEVPTSLNIDALIGVAGDGRPVESLTYGAVIETVRTQYDPQVIELPQAQALQEALDSGQRWMDAMVATILADTARAAEVTSTAQRPWVDGYVRMIEPGACSRCVVLAGKFFKYNQGFDRHPRCRCRHIPASENIAGDMLTSPTAYFESLGPAGQDSVFGKAGAEAIRMGADPAQVVNARRDMYRAQEFGVNRNGIYVATARSRSGLLYTTEGATTRGRAFRKINERFETTNGPIKTRIAGGTRYSRATSVRLMPESVLSLAKSPEDALRMLRLHGYVL